MAIEFQDEFEVIVVGAGHAGCEAVIWRVHEYSSVSIVFRQ
jgi:tRNA U34 5-carboxymethylaminomethyl modifying enzyme MnmG/GidA